MDNPPLWKKKLSSLGIIFLEAVYSAVWSAEKLPTTSDISFSSLKFKKTKKMEFRYCDLMESI
jgi:hypothetical protein